MFQMLKSSGEGVISFQEELYLARALENPNRRQNVSRALLIDGRVDIALLNRAFERVARRHEACRTRFVRRADSFVRVVEQICPVDISVLDLAQYGAHERAINDTVREFETKLFDLDEFPLVRMQVIYLAGGRTVLTVAMPHVLTDLASMRRLVKDLDKAYGAVAKGQEPDLLDLPFTLADFAYSHRQWMVSDDYLKCVQSLRDKYLRCLKRLEATKQPPAKKPWPCDSTVLLKEFPAAPLQELRTLTARRNVTVPSALLAVTALALAKTSQRRHFFYSTGCANRHQNALADIVGYLATTLLDFIDLTPDQTVAGFIAATQTQSLFSIYRFGLVPQLVAAETIATLEQELGFAKGEARPRSEVVDIYERTTSYMTHFGEFPLSLYETLAIPKATNDIKLSWDLLPERMSVKIRVPTQNRDHANRFSELLDEAVAYVIQHMDHPVTGFLA